VKIRKHRVRVDGEEMVIVMVRDVSDTYDLQNNREIELENN
jgi:hypothetical protein